MNQAKPQKPDISVAPMMDWTDRHCRYFHRLISPNVRLYTEMLTTGALIHGDRKRFLRFDPAEHPIALQLGGSDADDLAECARIGADAGYDEINLNCGCPSDRVQKGRFGACLMKEPDHVATCVETMIKSVSIPVTVKCRIGIDDQDDFEFLDNFVNRIADKGCTTFIIHARKAWLKGLSPKENRTKPPINYERVQAVKEKYPYLRIIVNGEIKDVPTIKKLLSSPRKRGSDSHEEPDPCLRRDDSYGFDGVMIGREAYQNPWLLAEIEREIYGNDAAPTREDVARAMIPYISRQMEEHDTPVKSVTRHMIGLFQGRPGAKAWRQHLSTLPHQDDADPDLINQSLAGLKRA